MLSFDALRGMSAIKARNALGGCADVPLLRRLVREDKRVAVQEKATSLLRRLGAPADDRTTEMKVCPHCGTEKPVVSDGVDDFGTRTLPSGKVAEQPWCRACRRASTKKART